MVQLGDHRKQLSRVAVNSLMFKWSQLTNGISEELVLEVVWFNVFAGGVESGIECILRKFVSDTKICGVTDMQGCHPVGP